MGRDVMSRSARVRYATSTSPSPSSRPKSLDRDRSMSDGPLHKSLTPQRKHHKLLKDGSEVWSEEVEKVFVEGLKQYWESPWATYSRGRSRWRNQFLVEHLKKAGIERSKKQVASHIQVLRNMWRGEPEFHLVAGGEELFQENGLLANNSQANRSPDNRDRHSRLESIGSSSSSDVSSMTDYPMQAASMSLPHDPSATIRGTSSPYRSTQPMYSSASSSSLAVALGTPPPSPLTDRIRAPMALEPLHMGTGLFTLPASPRGGYLAPADVSPVYAPQPLNRVLSLSLWSEGMSVFTADVDRIQAQMTMSQHSSQLPSILLRIKLYISIDDISGSPITNGVLGAVTFASRWQSEAKCITSVYCGQSCMTQEIGLLDGLETGHIHQAEALTTQSVTCTLPDSSLSRCKWLDPSQNTITQQIVIDGVVLAAFVYHLERTVVPSNGPSAEFVGLQRYRPTTKSNRSAAPQTMQQFSPPSSSVAPPSAAPSYFAPGSTYAQYPSSTVYSQPGGSVTNTGVPQAMVYSGSPQACMFGTRSATPGLYYAGTQ